MKVYVVITGQYCSPSDNLVGIYTTKEIAIKAQAMALMDGIVADVVEYEVEE